VINLLRRHTIPLAYVLDVLCDNQASSHVSGVPRPQGNSAAAVAMPVTTSGPLATCSPLGESPLSERGTASSACPVVSPAESISSDTAQDERLTAATEGVPFEDGGAAQDEDATTQPPAELVRSGEHQPQSEPQQLPQPQQYSKIGQKRKADTLPAKHGSLDGGYWGGGSKRRGSRLSDDEMLQRALAASLQESLVGDFCLCFVFVLSLFWAGPLFGTATAGVVLVDVDAIVLTSLRV
jgi:hypothetical protein